MNSPFKTTSWSLISRARGSEASAREATATLCRLYWQPLYVYARRAGNTAHEAEDVVQEFLIHVLEKDVFERADADRGRFRTFLLSSLQQFMARRHRDSNRMKRSPRSTLTSLDVDGAEQMVARSSASNGAPDIAFERAWALSQIDLAWQAVEAEYTMAGKADVFHALRSLIAGKEGRAVRDIADELNMTEGAVNVAVHRLRRRYGEALREQVAATLESPDDVDDEIARLRESLSTVN